jgi:hypothetical protein
LKRGVIEGGREFHLRRRVADVAGAMGDALYVDEEGTMVRIWAEVRDHGRIRTSVLMKERLD